MQSRHLLQGDKSKRDAAWQNRKSRCISLTCRTSRGSPRANAWGFLSYPTLFSPEAGPQKGQRNCGAEFEELSSKGFRYAFSDKQIWYAGPVRLADGRGSCKCVAGVRCVDTCVIGPLDNSVATVQLRAAWGRGVTQNHPYVF